MHAIRNAVAQIHAFEFFFNLMLTAPDIASAPYAAPAPPVIIHVLDECRRNRVQVDGHALDETMARLPSINTTLRLGPRPRRSISARPPLPGLFDVVVRRVKLAVVC